MTERRLGWAVFFALAATPAAAQDPAKPPVAGVGEPSTELSVQQINDRFVRQIAERIAGREDQPAGQVFKNMRIDWLKTEPGIRRLRGRLRSSDGTGGGALLDRTEARRAGIGNLEGQDPIAPSVLNHMKQLCN